MLKLPKVITKINLAIFLGVKSSKQSQLPRDGEQNYLRKRREMEGARKGKEASKILANSLLLLVHLLKVPSETSDKIETIHPSLSWRSGSNVISNRKTSMDKAKNAPKWQIVMVCEPTWSSWLVVWHCPNNQQPQSNSQGYPVHIKSTSNKDYVFHFWTSVKKFNLSSLFFFFSKSFPKELVWLLGFFACF